MPYYSCTTSFFNSFRITHIPTKKKQTVDKNTVDFVILAYCEDKNSKEIY